MLQRGGLMDEFWTEMVYAHPETEHACKDYGVALASNGESDFMICRKCGKGWIAPCRIKAKQKPRHRAWI